MSAEGSSQGPVVDRSRCKICNVCQMFCPDLCITPDETGECVEIDYSYCKGCSICAYVCPRKAISMNSSTT